MICAECLMRWRMAALQATGAEPAMESELVAGTAPVAHAVTLHQGHALCITHLMECVQLQVTSPLVAANGAPIVRPPAALNGARRA